jgi:hypothetical protein
VVPASGQRVPGWVLVAAVPLVILVVLAGTWVTAALVTNDETVARRLTFAWFVVMGVLAVVLALRWPRLAVPVIVTWLVTSGTVGGFLLLTSTVDRVVEEDVAVAPAPAPDGDGPAAGPVARAMGAFRDVAHPTSGTATLVERPDGGRVLTLTGFATDPGPDLRVMLVPDTTGESVDGGVDLGALKGNRGDQQYAVPADSPEGAVIIWCRAFTVSFGTAPLVA